jgi:molybdenum cofactor cytidylyltransferase
MGFTAIVPAAGRAERFGGGKLVADLKGQPLLERTLRSLLDAGANRVVVVTSNPDDLAPVASLRDARVDLVVNAEPDRGMFSSIQVGLQALPGDGQVIVLPGDMPFVRAETTTLVADEGARLERPVIPVFQGHRGHPISLPSSVLEGLRSFDAARSLKDALAAAAIERIELDVDDPGVIRDVDVRADLAEP